MVKNDAYPIVLYDNRCYVCTKFAKCVYFLSRGTLSLVGHYTEQGEKIRDCLSCSEVLEMFWFIDMKNAYGGRAGLFQLVKHIVKPSKTRKSISIGDDSCTMQCKNVKSVFVRSSSILKKSKKVSLQKNPIY